MRCALHLRVMPTCRGYSSSPASPAVPDDAKEGVGARVAALRDLYGV